MTRFFRWLLAVWRFVWLGWLRLLALPRRWLDALLGWKRPPPPAGPSAARRSDPAAAAKRTTGAPGATGASGAPWRPRPSGPGAPSAPGRDHATSRQPARNDTGQAPSRPATAAATTPTGPPSAPSAPSAATARAADVANATGAASGAVSLARNAEPGRAAPAHVQPPATPPEAPKRRPWIFVPPRFLTPRLAPPRFEPPHVEVPRVVVPVVRKPPAPGRFTDGVFQNDAGRREYKLYIPGDKADGPRPLVVMLHGCKQNPDDFSVGTQMNRLADQQGCLVLYPAQDRMANRFGCWNWFRRHDQARDAGEPSILAGMIEHVIARHDADRRRVYAVGLSAGGAMVMILAHTHPELLAAAGVHSGMAYAAAQDMITAMSVMKRGPRATIEARGHDGTGLGGPGVPLIVFHGDHDKTVHPLNGEQVIAQALGMHRIVRRGVRRNIVVEKGKVRGGRSYTRTLHCKGREDAHVEQWLVHGSGHAWSGGNPEGSFTDPLGPDASSEMLRFFLERTKP